MDSDFATVQDLAIAQVFCGSASRISKTFKLVEERLGSFKQSLNAPNSKVYREEFNSDGSVVWAWAYFKGPARIKDSWHIALGNPIPGH